MEITGKIIAVGDTLEGISRQGKTWRKRVFVIETIEQYPKRLALSLFNDRTEIDLPLGRIASVDFSVESREHGGRWFTEATAWKVTAAAPYTPQAHQPPMPQPGHYGNYGSDNLPY